MVNIYEWDAKKLRERRDSLLSANYTYHDSDDALDALIERHSMTIGDMIDLSTSIHRLSLLSLLTTPN